jgi:disulfide oxidoreductase YuzD
MEYILALILSAVLTITFIFFKKNKSTFIKPAVVKKDDLIQSYKYELLEILEENKENKELQFQEKIKFLKRVNNELSMNIFFDEIEAKKLIQELSGLGK